MRKVFSFLQNCSAKPAAAILAALCISGCAALPGGSSADDTTLVIPDFPTAEEQYSFASLYEKSALKAADPGRREKQLHREIQCYEKVVQGFPQDSKYTPLARLEIADARCSLGDYRKAAAEYETIYDSYPESEYIRARSLYTRARLLDQQLKYEEAQKMYRRVHEEFAGSSSGAVQDIVKRADKLYMRVRETKKPGRKSRS